MQQAHAVSADDTIPQNTEGDEYMTLSITPTSTSSKLLITVNAYSQPALGLRQLCFRTQRLTLLRSQIMTMWTARWSSFHYADSQTASTIHSSSGATTSGTTHFNGFSISNTRAWRSYSVVNHHHGDRSMTYNHQAIYRAYAGVVTIRDDVGAFDADGNQVTLDLLLMLPLQSCQLKTLGAI